MRVVVPVLDRFATRPLRVIEGDVEIRLGPRDAEGPAPDLRINHPAVWRAIGRGGISSLGSTYEDGWWSSDDLEGVIAFFVSLLSVLPATPHIDPIARRIRPIRDPWTGLGAADPSVQAHILDKTMFHGTGRFLDAHTDLYTASLARFSQICERLRLDGDSRLCELGTGWGAFSLYAARTRGCSVVTVTPSEVEADFARKRLANAGLTELVQVKVGPPTMVSGVFDAVVSIEAAVWQKAPKITADIDRLLDPAGTALVQTYLYDDPSLERVSFGASNTLSAITGSLASLRCRLVAASDLLDDQLRSVSARIANLEANQSELERAGFAGPVYRSRMFCLVLERVMADLLGSRAMQLVLSGPKVTPTHA